ncbi:MAG: hypothetical protein GC206_09855 [Alphaproteobacteria bacterium]|nr:hypothetical protein [Alphaproteobacteria bacterium]
MTASRTGAGGAAFHIAVTGAAALIAPAAMGQDASLQPTSNALPADARIAEVTVPIIISGRYAGDVAALLSLDGRAAVDAEQFLAIFEDVVGEQTLERVRRATGGVSYISIEHLNTAGLSAEYDPERLEIRVNLDADDRAEQQISLGRDRPAADINVIRPEPLAAGVTIALTQDYVHESPTRPDGAAPLRGGVRGGANFGGARGINLAFEGFYDAGAENVWQRGDVSFYWDHQDSATRVSLGDINPIGAGLQSSPGLGGIDVQRLYQEITPFRNIRPTGSTRFILDRPSVVEIYVNGAPYQTLRLNPGPYDLRDFPFVDGLNDVRVVVRDETGGLREVAAFSQFLSYDLLDGGVSEFELIVGLPTFASPTGNDYEDDVAFSAFYRRGVQDGLTLGAHAQGKQDAGMFGVTGVAATPFGVFFAETATSVGNGLHPGYAGSIGWNWTTTGQSGQTDLGLRFEAATEDFKPLDGIARLLDREYEGSAFARAPLPGGVDASLTAIYAPGRGAASDETRVNSSLSREFGPITGVLFYEWRDIFDREPDNRVLVSFSYRLGRRERLRGRYDTEADRYQFGWERQLSNALGAWGGRLGVEGDEGADGAFAQFDYLGNRAAGSIGHRYVETLPSGGLREQVTTADVEFGFGYAGGRAALGRAADRGFAIVDRHPTLSGRVDVESRSYGGVAARADWLGPALVPTYAAYQPTELSFSPARVPAGYSIGEGRAALRPAAFSGYRITVGSEASATVMGVLRLRSGEAVTLRGGWLNPVDGQEGGRVVFFTNREGRFVAEGLAPGRYDVVLAGQTRAIARISVSEDQTGLVDIGVVETAE